MTDTTIPAAKPVTVLKDKSAILALCDSIDRRGKKLDRDIQQAAVSAMAHHAEHGDVTLINLVVDCMPKGSRVNALREFIMAHGKVTWNEQTKAFAHDKEGNFDLEGALSRMWTEFKPEPEYKPITTAALLKTMLKRLDNLDPEKGDKVTAKEEKALRDVAAALGVE